MRPTKGGVGVNEGSENWEGVRTNTLLMILGDLARANEDMSDDDGRTRWRHS